MTAPDTAPAALLWFVDGCPVCERHLREDRIPKAMLHTHQAKANRMPPADRYGMTVHHWERQKGRCVHCGKKMRHPGRRGGAGRDDPRRTSLEHLWPRRYGGPDSMWNTAAAHLGCNEARGIGIGGVEALLLQRVGADGLAVMRAAWPQAYGKSRAA